jgi:transposase
MLNLEGFMNIRDLKQQGWTVSAIADELHLDRKTVRKHLLDAPQPYKRENPAPCKIDPYRPFLRERWEKGVHNASKLLDEIRGRGYDGGYSQLKLAVLPWREEGRERAFVRFETGPGELYGKSRVMLRGACIPWRFRAYHRDLSNSLFP